MQAALKPKSPSGSIQTSRIAISFSAEGSLVLTTMAAPKSLSPGDGQGDIYSISLG